jgi:hypothetical protein
MATTVATFFPSVGAYGGYNFDTATLTNVDASNGFGFLTGLEGVRTDPNFVLGPKTASGIVTFPSVHAGVAALMAWAAWPSALRYPVLALNFLMAVATVSHGAHYFVDIPAGLVVAVIAIRISRPSFAGSPLSEQSFRQVLHQAHAARPHGAPRLSDNELLKESDQIVRHASMRTDCPSALPD